MSASRAFVAPQQSSSRAGLSSTEPTSLRHSGSLASSDSSAAEQLQLNQQHFQQQPRRTSQVNYRSSRQQQQQQTVAGSPMKPNIQSGAQSGRAEFQQHSSNSSSFAPTRSATPLSRPGSSVGFNTPLSGQSGAQQTRTPSACSSASQMGPTNSTQQSSSTMGQCRICRKIILANESCHLCSNCNQFICEDCASYSSTDKVSILLLFCCRPTLHKQRMAECMSWLLRQLASRSWLVAKKKFSVRRAPAGFWLLASGSHLGSLLSLLNSIAGAQSFTSYKESSTLAYLLSPCFILCLLTLESVKSIWRKIIILLRSLCVFGPGGFPPGVSGRKSSRTKSSLAD